MKKPAMAAVIATLLYTNTALGDCENAAQQDAPVIPNGVTASLEQMIETREAVMQYLDNRSNYIECVKPQPFMHNYQVSRMESVAKAFNLQRQRFYAEQAALAAN